MVKIQSVVIGCCAGRHKMREYFLQPKVAFHVVKKVTEAISMFFKFESLEVALFSDA